MNVASDDVFEGTCGEIYDRRITPRGLTDTYFSSPYNLPLTNPDNFETPVWQAGVVVDATRFCGLCSFRNYSSVLNSSMVS